MKYLFLLLIAGVCMGQKQEFPKLRPCKNLPGFSCPVDTTKPAPLKCGKGSEYSRYVEECVKWNPKAKGNGDHCYTCVNGNCGGCVSEDVWRSDVGGALAGPEMTLKCGKWEHPEAKSCNTCDEKTHTCLAVVCITLPPDHCAPDLHTVTEKDWQEMLERLKKLEAK